MSKSIKRGFILTCILGTALLGCTACGNSIQKNQASAVSEENQNVEDVKTYTVDDTATTDFSFDGTGEDITINTEE